MTVLGQNKSGRCPQVATIQRWPLTQVGLYSLKENAIDNILVKLMFIQKVNVFRLCVFSWEERLLLFREEIALNFGFVNCITGVNLIYIFYNCNLL